MDIVLNPLQPRYNHNFSLQTTVTLQQKSGTLNLDV